MKRWLRFICVVGVLGLVAAACGDDDGGTAVGTDTTTPAGSDTTVAAGPDSTVAEAPETTAATTASTSGATSGATTAATPAATTAATPAATTAATKAPTPGSTRATTATTRRVATTVAAGPTTTKQPNFASARGVTADTIKIGITVADLDALRRAGQDLPPSLTVDNLAKRYYGYFNVWNDQGGVAGRKIEYVVIPFDSTRPASYIEGCNKAAKDEKVFMMLYAASYREDALLCLTKDNDVFTFGGTQSIAQEVYNAAGDNFFTLRPYAELAADYGARGIHATGKLSPSDKIGYLHGNTPTAIEAAKQFKDNLKRLGYNVDNMVEVTLNTLTGQPAVITPESVAAANKMQQENVTAVFEATSFIGGAPFLNEANKNGFKPKWFSMEAEDSCTAFQGSRLPVTFEGALCTTILDVKHVINGKFNDDNAFEAQCRKDWEVTFDEKTSPGVSSGGVRLPNGQLITGDQSYTECNQMYILKQALEKVGANLTNQSLAAAMKTITSGPAGLMSDGKGGFGPNKRYWANFAHTVQFRGAAASTVQNVRGLWNDCPAPNPCWHIIPPNQWISITG